MLFSCAGLVSCRLERSIAPFRGIITRALTDIPYRCMKRPVKSTAHVVNEIVGMKYSPRMRCMRKTLEYSMRRNPELSMAAWKYCVAAAGRLGRELIGIHVGIGPQREVAADVAGRDQGPCIIKRFPLFLGVLERMASWNIATGWFWK